MGFWSGLTKVVQGKPVFEVEDEQAGNRPATRTNIVTAVAATNGRKIIPEISIENCESDINGSEMEVTAWITNTSSDEIELDKIVMLGLTTELDRIFSPGHARELRLYKGKVPTTDSYHTASLYYKRRRDGDYFQADFTIEYDYDSRGFYKVEEFHPIRPIRDI